MHVRLNVTLPEETVRIMDRVAKRGGRSRLITEAVRRYVRDLAKARLRRRLKEGAIRRADRDQQLAHEWFAIEEEAWPENRG